MTRETPSMRAGGRAGAGLGWISFFALVLAAWAALFMMQEPDVEAARLFGADYWRALCRLSAAETSWPVLFGMWALMAAAMMAPTAAPALMTYADLAHAGAGARFGTVALVGGYVAVWLLYAALAALAQGALADARLLDPQGHGATSELTVLLLALAGLYQFSPLKHACLSRCRAPLAFFMAHWRPGVGAALAMGARLGADCAGCCWALMSLALVFGATNLAWMGAATVMMTLEKLPRLGRPLTRPLGWALLAAAAWTLARDWAGVA